MFKFYAIGLISSRKITHEPKKSSGVLECKSLAAR
jgi:hypothetical protein